jgi:hypothetical protein
MMTYRGVEGFSGGLRCFFLIIMYTNYVAVFHL